MILAFETPSQTWFMNSSILCFRHNNSGERSNLHSMIILHPLLLNMFPGANILQEPHRPGSQRADTIRESPGLGFIRFLWPKILALNQGDFELVGNRRGAFNPNISEGEGVETVGSARRALASERPAGPPPTMTTS